MAKMMMRGGLPSKSTKSTDPGMGVYPQSASGDKTGPAPMGMMAKDKKMGNKAMPFMGSGKKKMMKKGGKKKNLP